MQKAGYGFLDVTGVEAVYRAILETYDADLLSALARSCASLLEGMQEHLEDGTCSGWLPALLVLLQSPLNGEATFAGARCLP
eukprot:1186082-Prorocentrum_minimum.AAC.2